MCVFVASYIILMHWLNVRFLNKLRRPAAVICLLIELAAIGYFTVLFREAGTSYSYEFELFWSYKKWIFEKNVGLGMEIINNILLFFPLGFILTDVYKKCPLWLVTAHAFIISSCVEISQFVFKIGLFEFDDLLNNVLGAVAGWMVFQILRLGEYFREKR